MGNEKYYIVTGIPLCNGGKNGNRGVGFFVFDDKWHYDLHLKEVGKSPEKIPGRIETGKFYDSKNRTPSKLAKYVALKLGMTVNRRRCIEEHVKGVWAVAITGDRKWVDAFKQS